MSVKIPAICCVESNALKIVNESTRLLPQQADVSIFIQIVLQDNLFPPFFFAQTREIRISENQTRNTSVLAGIPDTILWPIKGHATSWLLPLISLLQSSKSLALMWLPIKYESFLYLLEKEFDVIPVLSPY